MIWQSAAWVSPPLDARSHVGGVPVQIVRGAAQNGAGIEPGPHVGCARGGGGRRRLLLAHHARRVEHHVLCRGETVWTAANHDPATGYTISRRRNLSMANTTGNRTQSRCPAATRGNRRLAAPRRLACWCMNGTRRARWRTPVGCGWRVWRTWPRVRCIAVRVGEREIALYHLPGGDFRATDNICTHEYAQLSDGWLEDGCIECPLHAARFDVRTGKALCAPAEENLRCSR